MDNISFITGVLRLGKYSNGKERIYKIMADPEDDYTLAVIFIDPADNIEKTVSVDLRESDAD